MLKEVQVSLLVLITFRNKEFLRIEMDALDLALGIYITQFRDGYQRPIVYYSYKFIGLEEQYDVYNKEFLVIVEAL